jgi:hypothetical protein
MLTCLVFVAGAVSGGVVGHWLGWRPYSARSVPAPADRLVSPATRRSVMLAPTHPATHRPPLYDWERDGAA